MKYFDNAATSWPKPESVYLAMDRFAREHAGNPGRSSHQLALAAEQMLRETRQRVAKLFGAESPERIAFALNGTDALNLALKGVLRPGDHVVTSVLEHNSLARPLAKLEREGVITVTRVSCGRDTTIDPQDVRKAFMSRTRLVAMTHASNVTGAVQPIAEIARLAKAHEALLLVDAAQTAGVLPIDVRALGIDLLATPGHKALLGPTGTGVLYVRAGLELATSREGGTGSHSEDLSHPSAMPERLEAGTPNTVGLAGLGAALAFLTEHESDEGALAQRFVSGLAADTRITVHGPKAPQLGIVSLTLPLRPSEASAILDQHFAMATRAGLHCAPGTHGVLGTLPEGTLRFSFGHFNTIAEIDEATSAVLEIAAS